MNHDRANASPTGPVGVYVSHPACVDHDPGVHMPAHPDVPERLVAIERALAAGAAPGWERLEAPLATSSELELIHTARHVEGVGALCARGGGLLDPDTAVSERSFHAASLAAGAACAMVRELLEGSVQVGFCAVRPPGHHAEADRAMGFCVFNNVAIAAALAVAELSVERVFILDWDVHHGNGTAESFRARSDVLYASIHEFPLYPGTGPLDDAGSGAGEGYTINLPVAAGSGEELWLSLLEHVALPAALAFRPELVLISAGFDAHRTDPLAGCELESSSFAEMARLMRDLARAVEAPLGVVLEGGYNPPVLAECVGATLSALAGEDEARSGLPAFAATLHAAAQVGRYWPLPMSG